MRCRHCWVIGGAGHRVTNECAHCRAVQADWSEDDLELADRQRAESKDAHAKLCSTYRYRRP